MPIVSAIIERERDGEMVRFEDLFPRDRPLSLRAVRLPPMRRVLVLGPHPDDFDAIGVTLRLLKENGNPIHVGVVRSGSGVQDSYCSPPALERKAAIREAEQRRNCRFFGLPEARLTFLLNRDPKTITMRIDLYTEFGEDEATWKARMLRFHDSQQRRNLDMRGHGFDERILNTNRQIAQEISCGSEYAEAFELELYGVPPLTRRSSTTQEE